MEPETGGQIERLITVMNLVKAPEKIVVVVDHMPEVDREIIKEEGHQPLDGPLLNTVQKTMA